MKSVICADFGICFIVLIVALTGLTEAELEQSKNRRGVGGTSQLFSFPRVGRSDPSLSNNLHEAETAAFVDSLYPPASSMEDYEDYSKSDMKRASLMAFPRVGRTDAEIRKLARMLALQQAFEKRTGPSATTGLWFGPRLGKRSIDASEQQHASNGQKEQF